MDRRLSSTTSCEVASHERQDMEQIEKAVISMLARRLAKQWLDEGDGYTRSGEPEGKVNRER